MNQIKYVVLIMLSVLWGCKHEPTIADYPNSDAVYLNVTKYFTLNKDGSIVQRVEKKQKLFTYRAFQSLFGDTRITYNPEIQSLKILEAYTRMADGTKVLTPDNGYNEVLPRSCADSKALNHMREMVVTHTGLERGAVINCSYELTTKAGVMPFLMGNELLCGTCPNENLKLVLKVPAGTSLNYDLFNSDVSPSVKKGSESDSYVWLFEKLPAMHPEPYEPTFNKDLPRLVFSTQKNAEQAADLFSGQKAFNEGFETMPALIKKINAQKKTDTEKMHALHRMLVEDINTLPVPAALTAFRLRTPQQVWESNSGSPMEKAVLLAAGLQSIGADAEVCLSYPSVFNADKHPFLLMAKPYVKVKPKGGETLFLSPVNLKDNALRHGYVSFSPKNKTVHAMEQAKREEIRVTGRIELKAPDTLTTDLEGCEGGTNQSAQMRGTYCFVTLPESSKGLVARHLRALPLHRHSALEFGSPLTEEYKILMTVADGYTLLNKHITQDISLPFGKLSITIEQKNKEISITKYLEINPSLIEVQDYAAFRKLLNEWNLKKYRQLVFRVQKIK